MTLFPNRLLLTALVMLPAMGARAEVPADVITVGDGGFSANCTVGTIQAAVDLAEETPGPNRIWISRSTGGGYYLPGAAINIDDQDLEIVGGFDDCFDDAPEGYTDISGFNGPADPVIRIRGDGVVVLDHLTLTLGDADIGEGSGIDYFGRGQLHVRDSVIEYNHSSGNGSGGGIYFRSPTSADLTIERSRISGNSADDGGGVAFSGSGHLFVNDTEFSNNSARGSGGGIHAYANVGVASLYLMDGVSVTGNQAADDGGGIHLSAAAVLEWVGGDASLWLNVAGDMGGGLYVTDDASADLSLRGRLSVPGQYHATVYGNEAVHGGAIAIQTSDSPGSVPVRLSPYDAQHPPVVGYNQASQTGGAFFLQARSTSDAISRPVLCLDDTMVVGNAAPRGAAVYAKRSSGGNTVTASNVHVNVALNRCGFDRVPPRCPAGHECSLFQANQSTLGAVIDFEPSSTYGNGTEMIEIYRARLIANTGTHLVYASGGDDISVVLDTVLMAQNALGTGLIRTPDSWLGVYRATVADNTFASPSPVLFDIGNLDRLRLITSIFAQPAIPTIAFATGEPGTYPAAVSGNLSSDPELTNYGVNFLGEPLFGTGYQLRLDSPAVDRVYGDPRVDLAGNPRPIDQPIVPNAFNATADIGAYELQLGGQSDALFSSGFE